MSDEKYSIILEFAVGSLTLPVLPEKLEVKCAGDNGTAKVLSLGEVSLLRTRKLREITISSVFPAAEAPWVSGPVSQPMACVRAIQAQRDAKKPLRMLLEGFDLDLNTAFSIEDFTYAEQFGTVGDLSYTLKLKEYRAPAARRVTLPDDTGGKAVVEQAPRAGEPETAKTYTVVSGDCLWSICRRCYGDGSRYPELYEKNKDVIDAGNRGKSVSKYTIYPGQSFTL